MKNQVHVALQIVPISKKHPYPIIDKAIEVIRNSGVDFRVGAMETAMQGEYKTLMKVVEQAQDACFENGADEIVVTIKVHASRGKDVKWEDKLGKYS